MPWRLSCSTAKVKDLEQISIVGEVCNAFTSSRFRWQRCVAHYPSAELASELQFWIPHPPSEHSAGI